MIDAEVRLELLLAARRRASDHPLVAARAEALPFADGAFDTVVSGGCYPNRDTEAMVRAAGFTIDRTDRRSRRNVRLLTARLTGG